MYAIPEEDKVVWCYEGGFYTSFSRSRYRIETDTLVGVLLVGVDMYKAQIEQGKS